jgi:hypothetical protein
MDTPMAASYLCVSATSFRKWAGRRGLKPVDLGMAVTRWRRSDLDGALEDNLARDNEPSAEVASAQAAALAAAKQRKARHHS